MTPDDDHTGGIPVTLIVAADLDDCIGKDGGLPWRLRSDLRWFQSITTGHTCIVGSKTQASIVARIGRPLPDRISVVLTRHSGANTEDVVFAGSPQRALTLAAEAETLLTTHVPSREIFVIGGATVYTELLPYVSKVYLTRVQTVVDGDTFMPKHWLLDFTWTESVIYERSEQDEFSFTIQTLERRIHG